MGKVLKKVTKPIQKLIPKEIKPFLPALAAVFGPAAFAGTGIFSSAALASLPVGVQAAIASGLTSTLTEGKPDLKSAALSGIMAQAGPSLKGYGNAGSNIPLESATPKTFLQKAATATGEYLSPSSINTLVNNPSSMSLGDVGSALYSGAKASLPVSAYTGTEKLKEINEDELRKYNEQLRERGVTDKIGRRKGIYDIYASIEDEGDDGTYRVYSDDYINSILDKYGYKKGGGVEKPKPIELPQDPFSELIEEFIKDQKRQEEIRKQYKANGGRIGFEEGGEVAALAAEVKRLQSENAELKSKSGLRETREGIDFATKGFEQAFGGPLMGQMPSPQRIVPGFGLMNGGRVNFEMGGNVSPTDSSEEGIGGVIYEDEDGNIISKKEAMDIFNKQAEEEAEEKENKAMGGIINLMKGGMPSMEMDYRGGGFIPVGAKERADDVPARLSKNEFVMTADAVRAAGGGSVNEGARRMYELMNSLEARV